MIKEDLNVEINFKLISRIGMITLILNVAIGIDEGKYL